MTLDYLIEQLKTNGFKTTGQRLVILDVLINNIDAILSADDLYKLILKKDNTINRSTVYRTLELLESLELLHKSINDSGISRVKLICSAGHHHHMICDKCGKIVIYTSCDHDKYYKFAEANGFVLTGHTLELHGVCSECQSNS